MYWEEKEMTEEEIVSIEKNCNGIASLVMYKKHNKHVKKDIANFLTYIKHLFVGSDE